MARIGRPPRTPIPKGADAEEELRKIQRNKKRAERRAKKKAIEDAEAGIGVGLPPTPGLPGPAPLLGRLKTAEELKQDFQDAFDALGGVAGLVAWGARYPKEFYAIWARMNIPKSLGGDGGSSGGIEDIIAQLDGATVN